MKRACGQVRTAGVCVHDEAVGKARRLQETLVPRPTAKSRQYQSAPYTPVPDEGGEPVGQRTR
jgi:hypothetical protein